MVLYNVMSKTQSACLVSRLFLFLEAKLQQTTLATYISVGYCHVGRMEIFSGRDKWWARNKKNKNYIILLESRVPIREK